jgi:hypothetical protein
MSPSGTHAVTLVGGAARRNLSAHPTRGLHLVVVHLGGGALRAGDVGAQELAAEAEGLGPRGLERRDGGEERGVGRERVDEGRAAGVDAQREVGVGGERRGDLGPPRRRGEVRALGYADGAGAREAGGVLSSDSKVTRDPPRRRIRLQRAPCRP